MYCLLFPFIYLIIIYILYKNNDVIQLHYEQNKIIYHNLKTYHNYVMAIISFINIILTLYIAFMNNKMNSLHALLCYQYDNMIDLIYINSIIFMMSKIIEWIDTFFLIVFNKELTTLHLFHHSTTFSLTYIQSFPYPESIYI